MVLVSSRSCYIYTVNDSVIDDDPVLLQTITIGAGAGTCISMSDDQNWIYVGDPLNNQVIRLSRERIPLTAGYFTATETYEITSLGTEVGASDITTGQSYQILFPGSTEFTQLGAVDNEVGTTFTATTPPAGFVAGDGICYEKPNRLYSNRCSRKQSRNFVCCDWYRFWHRHSKSSIIH